MSKIYGDTVGGGGLNLKKVPQSDWNQDDDTQCDYIKNKPNLGSLASKDEVTKSDLASDVQVSLEMASDLAEIGEKALKDIERVEWTLHDRTDVWYAQSHDARITIFENLGVGSEALIFDTDYIPDVETQYELIKDGTSYFFKFAHFDLEGGDALVPDFMIKENGTLDTSFCLVILIAPTEHMAAISCTAAKEHIVSLYQVGARKLPEEYLPTPDAELNPESERPVQNKVVARAIEELKASSNGSGGVGWTTKNASQKEAVLRSLPEEIMIYGTGLCAISDVWEFNIYRTRLVYLPEDEDNPPRYEGQCNLLLYDDSNGETYNTVGFITIELDPNDLYLDTMVFRGQYVNNDYLPQDVIVSMRGDDAWSIIAYKGTPVELPTYNV